MYIASADLAGKEYDENGELLYNFPGGSVVIGPGGTSDSGKYSKDYAGGASVQEPGMYTGEITLSSARGGDVNSFHHILYLLNQHLQYTFHLYQQWTQVCFHNTIAN